MKPAVCVIIPCYGGQCLAISRRNDFTQWGLPGGKVDSFETNGDAIHRETYEETCLILNKYLLQPIYSGACYSKDGQDFWVTTYLYEGSLGADIIPETGFQLKPMSVADLCNKEISPFAEYNRALFVALDSYNSGK